MRIRRSSRTSRPTPGRRGLWNLFLPHKTQWTDGLSNLDYAPLAEIMGRSPLASEACNCAAPDTGNMEILTQFGTPEQQEQWLHPLLEGEIRSAFAMTEPAVASSDATNIATRIERQGDEYVINGRKWFISGAASDRCTIFIVMGKTDPDGPPHRQQSMVLVPRDTPGVTVVRNMTVFGYTDREGHCEVTFDDVRVPVANVLGEEGGGFAIAQARLGPGRIHHCMRTIGAAERALELLCQRGVVAGRLRQDDRRARRLGGADRQRPHRHRPGPPLHAVHRVAAWTPRGNKAARTEIAGIKVAVPVMALKLIDDAIQMHGAGGVSQDFPLAKLYAGIRSLRLADGPDEVHRRTIAQRELRKHQTDVRP